MRNPFDKLENKRDYQLFDFRSVVWAGIIAGFVFLTTVCLLLPLVFPQLSTALLIRMFASLILGDSTLTPATFTPYTFGAAIVVNVVLSVGFTSLVAFIVHKWGMLASILGGFLLGAALFAINFYSMTYFFPWFWVLKTEPMFIAHLLFGALAGGLYEYFEKPKV